MSIAKNLLELIGQYVPSDGPARVKAIRVRIGEMTGVVPESLRFCFEVASEGTPAHGAELQIERVPIVGQCTKCRADFEVEEYFFVCPCCKSTSVELVSGAELDVVELELEEPILPVSTN